MSIQIKKILFFLSIGFALNAQTYHHTTFWSRLAFQKSLKKFDFRGEVDFRQQNDFQKSNINPFQKPLLRWARLSTTYSTGNFSHSLIMPQFVKNYGLVGKKGDLSRPGNNEIRYTFNEEYAYKHKNLSSTFRLGYEFRNITSQNITTNIGRLRLRFMQAIKFSDKASVNASYESLLNVKPNSATNRFNQSQLAFRFLQKFGKNTQLTIGINHLYRQRNNIEEYDLENALLCNFQIIL